MIWLYRLVYIVLEYVIYTFWADKEKLFNQDIRGVISPRFEITYGKAYMERFYMEKPMELAEWGKDVKRSLLVV